MSEENKYSHKKDLRPGVRSVQFLLGFPDSEEKMGKLEDEIAFTEFLAEQGVYRIVKDRLEKLGLPKEEARPIKIKSHKRGFQHHYARAEQEANGVYCPNPALVGVHICAAKHCLMQLDVMKDSGVDTTAYHALMEKADELVQRSYRKKTELMIERAGRHFEEGNLSASYACWMGTSHEHRTPEEQAELRSFMEFYKSDEGREWVMARMEKGKLY